MNALALVDDPLFSEHRAPGPHPERPERLDALRAAVARADPALPRLEVEACDASEEELERVHRASYLARLGQAAGKSGFLDADTYYCPASVAAARRAAGGAAKMVDSLLDGRARYGVALLRPPGHHATPDRAMGFCLLNNVAVAAAQARARGAARVMVLDWDVHHGNGTQDIFYDDPSVLFVSLHQYPFYPGTGAATETGSGDGRGATVNIPLSAGADDAVYQTAFERVVAPIAEQFDPDLLLVSAGFDAHARDPLASMAVTEAGYVAMLRTVARALPRGAAGRLGFVLEGGYDLAALGGSLQAVLETLDDWPASAPVPHAPSALHEAEISRVVSAQKAFWKLG